MRTMIDAAALPHELGPVQIIAGYLPGGHPARVWNTADWDRAKELATWLLPIRVYGDVDNADAGTADANAQVDDARAIGAPNSGVALALDLELNVAERAAHSGYVTEWAAEIRARGYVPVVYTSEAGRHFFSENPIAWEWWLAEWNNEPHLIAGTVATQYASPTTNPALAVDVSLVNDSLPLWPAKATPDHKPGGNEVPRKIAIRDVNGGYYIFGDDGGVFAFGEAKYLGSLPGKKVELADDALITDVSLTSTGKGYTMLGADGGVFCFGDAQFFGSIPGAKLAADHPHATAVPMSHTAAAEVDPVTQAPTDRALQAITADHEPMTSHLAPPGSTAEAQAAAASAAPSAPPARLE